MNWNHYLTVALRGLKRRRFATTVNLLGLSLGIATFLIIVSYVRYELSYDSYVPNAEAIYRVDYEEYQDHEVILRSAKSHEALSSDVTHFIPQVTHATKALYEDCLLFNNTAKSHEKGLWVDSTFFNVFQLKLLQGNAAKALVAPHTMVIARSKAKAFFGDKDPMGQVIYFNEWLPFTITGVFEDVPANASVQYSFLISWTTILELYHKTDGHGTYKSTPTYTFVTLAPGANIATVNQQLTHIANTNIPSLKERNLTAGYSLTPLRQLHFSTGRVGEIEPGSNKFMLYALVSVAIFILIAAWVNYINLSLAQSFQRANEIVIRKVYGAGLMQISNQFLAEAVIIAAITALTGFGMYLLLTAALSGYLGSGFRLTQHLSLHTFGYLLAAMAVVILISLYPARIIARYKPAFILAKQYIKGNNRNYFTNGLLVFQLCLSIFTIAATLVAFRQLHFIRHFNVGFNTENTISLRGPASRNTNDMRHAWYKAFRADAMNNSQMVAGTACLNIPGQEIRKHDETIRLAGGNNDKKYTYWIANIDEGYLPVFGLTLLAGRNITETDKGNGCLVNEAAIKALGFTNPANAVNATIISGKDSRIHIVGVIQDYHQQSVRKAVAPVIFEFRHPKEFGYYTFRVKAADRSGVLAHLNQVWHKHYPDDPFEYYFMDDFFARQYKDDQLFSKLLGLFSIISVTVAALGLLGMAYFTIIKRLKEISIRKVIGASAWKLVLLVSKDYIRLVILAFIITVPMVWFCVRQWLGTFAYRIDLQWWMLLLPGVAVLLVAWAVTSLRALKAARMNPIIHLKAD